jgi:hypothetical protein
VNGQVNLPNLPIFLALTNVGKAITSRDFESVLGLTVDADLLCLFNALQHLDPEPSFSESIATFTPSELTGELA